MIAEWLPLVLFLAWKPGGCASKCIMVSTKTSWPFLGPLSRRGKKK